MNGNCACGRLTPFLMLALLWIAAFAMACRLSESLYLGLGERTMLSGAIGALRFALSGEFIGHADRWFHKGVGRYHKKGFENYFTRLYEDIKPAGHVHLEGEGVNDIIPPLFFAAKMDPSNVHTYSLAAFFLAREAGRPDLADGVLSEAQRRNPRDYRIYYERGKLALKSGARDDAARYLDAAIRLWTDSLEPDSADARGDLAGMLTYRGLLFEMDDDTGKAIELYSRVLQLFPERAGLRERVVELDREGRATASPSDVWKMMLLHHPLVCGHDHEHD